MTRRSALAALVAMAADCVPSSSREPASPRRTAPNAAPNFTVSTLDGRVFRLSDLRGRPVLLNFWATWCAPCRIETPWLVDLYATYHARGVEFLGVSLDEAGDARKVAEFAHRMRMTYPVLLGTREAADAYGGVRLMPQTFFISRGGTIETSTVGITSKADIDAAIEQIARAASEA